jgi:hypothetical protein
MDLRYPAFVIQDGEVVRLLDGQGVAVVVCVERKRHPGLPHVGEALRGACFCAQGRDYRNDNARQDANDGDAGQQFDKREAAALGEREAGRDAKGFI